MAQRFATEFVKASIELTEKELTRMVHWFAEQGTTRLLVQTDLCGRKLVFRQEGGEQITFHFRRTSDKFKCEGSYRLQTLPMADVMRKAVSLFKGDAIVNRIYANFTMVYIYERGSVVKIMESQGRNQRVIYDYHNLAGRLERLFAQNRIEREIAGAREAINALLDRRLLAKEEGEKMAIDRELSRWRHRLFVLEA